MEHAHLPSQPSNVPVSKKVGRPRKRKRVAGGRNNLKTKEASNNESTVVETHDAFTNVSELYCQPVGNPIITRSTNNPEQIQNVLPTPIDVDDKNDFSTTSGIGENILLTASSLSDFIEENFCSKEYVSHGMVTLLNQFAIYVTKEIDIAVTKIINCDDRNPRSRKEYINNILSTELNVNEWKTAFIRGKNHPRKYIYKCLGDDYLNPVKVRYETYGLATNVYVEIFTNIFQRRSNKIKKNHHDAITTCSDVFELSKRME